VSAVATTMSELPKLAAFFRRDLFVQLSYRLAFVTDWFALVVQIVMFSFVSKMVDESTLPLIAGKRPSYLEFVIVGITITSFIGVGVSRLVSALGREQSLGTLEVLLLTPTHPITVQLGSVAYDLLYVPIRTAIFILLASLVFGIDIHLRGLLPAVLVISAFIPVVWGIGMATAAARLTYRRASSVSGFAMTALTLTSGAYFPLKLFPGWVQGFAEANPIALALRAMREALIGGVGYTEAMPEVIQLLCMGGITVLIGVVAFTAAVERERRLGTLGLY
jgi:ABC-2 type transport system permease protein